MWKLLSRFRFILPVVALFTFTSFAYAWDKGIYITQFNLENSKKLDYYLREAKASGINTFVVDHEYFSKYYAPAAAKLKAAGFKHVARVVVFEDGGYPKQVKSQAYWEGRYKLVDEAIKAGADVIQLDYIRYSSKMPANPQHAKDVYEVIKWFKAKINGQNIPMEIDIFGEVSYHPSMHIGQDLKMFADSVDGMNPMVYPSHFWPYQKYSAEPYKTVNDSLNALVAHFDNKTPFKVHAFIEAANYHYLKKTSNAQKQKYLLQQIRAVEDANGVSGWYVWSANNVYENLFNVLKSNKIKNVNTEEPQTAKNVKPEDKTIKVNPEEAKKVNPEEAKARNVNTEETKTAQK